MAHRKLVTALLVATGLAALAGCGSSSKTPSSGGGSNTPTSATPVTQSSGGNGYHY